MEDFSCEHLFPTAKNNLKNTIEILNAYRTDYINEECGFYHDKDVWWQMIQLLPSSYNQTRNVMMNYEVLCNIYKSRKDHKLDEWKELCSWIESLPYSELIVGSLSLKSVEVGETVTAEFKPKMLFGEPFPWIKEDKEGLI